MVTEGVAIAGFSFFYTPIFIELESCELLDPK
jgi:hypothetical protein